MRQENNKKLVGKIISMCYYILLSFIIKFTNFEIYFIGISGNLRFLTNKYYFLFISCLKKIPSLNFFSIFSTLRRSIPFFSIQKKYWSSIHTIYDFFARRIYIMFSYYFMDEIWKLEMNYVFNFTKILDNKS